MYWIIEHPSRGAYIGHDKYGNGTRWNENRPRFSWSVLRSDQKVRRFSTLDEAKESLDSFPYQDRPKCYVLSMGNFPNRPVKYWRGRGDQWQSQETI